MTHYDFHELLEPYEYQDLVCDVLQIRENARFEVYKEGRDQGIDGSFLCKEGQVIVQAKRCKMRFNDFLRLILKNELPKVKKIDPSRYILAVSMDFTPEQKQKIVDLFCGYIHYTSDIITQSDINLLFEKPEYDAVQMAYPKLWYASLQVMKKAIGDVVNAGYYTESKYELMEAIDQSATYVSTSAYKNTIKNWNIKKTTVITGVPGIGKTSMARALALSFLQGHDLKGYVWVHSVQEIYEHWNDAQRAVFILDDFWGSIFREEHTNQEESRLIKLMRIISDTKEDKRLILTTREYILQQGYRKYPELEEAFEKYAYVSSLEEYSISEKASILYRHLYESNLKYDYVKYLYDNSDRIVYHENYEPRALALFLSEIQPVSTPQDYLAELLEHFDSPTAFWESIYVKLTQDAKFVAMMTMISSVPLSYECLRQCYDKYILNTGAFYVPIKLEECITELEKTLIVTNYDENIEEIVLRFRLPVVQDFLYKKLYDNAQKYVQMMVGECCYYNQYAFLYKHLAERCSTAIRAKLVNALIANYEIAIDSSYDYCSGNEYTIDYDDEPSNINLSRFRQLVNLFATCQDEDLKEFLEKTAQGFLSKLGNGEYEEDYYDLWNLPGDLVRMQAVGLKIPSSDMVDVFQQYAFSIHHFESMLEFEKLYPGVYNKTCKLYLEKVSCQIDDRVIAEIYDLLDLGMEYEIDMILESTKDIYNRMGWDYSRDFERKMYEAAEREYDINQYAVSKLINENIEEDDYQKPFVQCQLDHTWILGPADHYIESEGRIERIVKKDLLEEMKCSIIRSLENSKGYVRYYVETEGDVDFYFDALQKHGYKALPDKELEFLIAVLLEVCNNDFSIAGKIIDVLTICYSMFCHSEEPVVRKEFLYCDKDIIEYFKDEQVKQIFEKYFMCTDGMWVRFNHVPVFILAFVMVSVNLERSGDGELDYELMFVYDDSVKHVQSLNVAKNAKEEAYYSEFGSYPFNNIEWEFCMHRLYEAYDPWEFNRKYVYKAVREVLNSIRKNNIRDEIKALVMHVELSVLYDEKENAWSMMYSSDCYIDLLINLGLLEIDIRRDIPLGTEKMLEWLKGEDGINWGNTKCYSLAKIDDFNVLKQVIDEPVLCECISRLKYIHDRFEEGYFIISDA